MYNHNFHNRPGGQTSDRPNEAHQWDCNDEANSVTTTSAPRMEVRKSAKLYRSNSLTTACPGERSIVLVLDNDKTSHSIPETLTRQLQKVGAEDPEMASKPIGCPSKQSNATLDHFPGVCGPAFATFLLRDNKIAEELNFEETDVVYLFGEQNYKKNMCARITSTILVLTVSVLGPGRDEICSALFPSSEIARKPLPLSKHVSQSCLEQHCPRQWRNYALFHLGDLQVHVHFGVVKRIEILLLIAPWFIERSVKEIFAMEGHIACIRSHPIANISKYMQLSHLLAMLECDSDPVSSIDDRQENHKSTQLFRVTKCITILPNMKPFVSVMTSSTRLIHMAPYPHSRQNRLVLPASGTVNALAHVPITVHRANISKQKTTLLNGMVWESEPIYWKFLSTWTKQQSYSPSRERQGTSVLQTTFQQ